MYSYMSMLLPQVTTQATAFFVLFYRGSENLGNYEIRIMCLVLEFQTLTQWLNVIICFLARLVHETRHICACYDMMSCYCPGFTVMVPGSLSFYRLHCISNLDTVTRVSYHSR